MRCSIDSDGTIFAAEYNRISDPYQFFHVVNGFYKMNTTTTTTTGGSVGEITRTKRNNGMIVLSTLPRLDHGLLNGPINTEANF